MDDLLIHKIAPLCPFLYLTLRLLCKKYWKALDRKNIESFGRIFCLYLQKDNLYLRMVLVKPEERMFFIKAVEPEFRDYPVIRLARYRGKKKGFEFEFDRPFEHKKIDLVIGRKNHQDFAEYICQNMCQLKCCGNTWNNYLTSLRKEWMLSYDAADKIFILECFFFFFSSFFF